MISLAVSREALGFFPHSNIQTANKLYLTAETGNEFKILNEFRVIMINERKITHTEEDKDCLLFQKDCPGESTSP